VELSKGGAVVVADRPFFHAIRDNSSGLLLLVGTMIAPS